MTKLLIGNKGLGLNDLATVGSVLVMTGILLSIGTWIQSDLAHSMATVSTITNESVNFAVNKTFYSLAYPLANIVSITNETTAGTLTIGSGNYTTRDNGEISQVNFTFCAATAQAMGTFKVTYSTYGNDTYQTNRAYSVMANSTDAVAKLSAWLPIIAIVFAAGIILGVLSLAFMVRPGVGV